MEENRNNEQLEILKENNSIRLEEIKTGNEKMKILEKCNNVDDLIKLKKEGFLKTSI